MRSARLLLAAAVAALAVDLAACTRPEPPTVKPVSGRVTAITNAGLDAEATLEATNPNDFAIDVKSFTAKLTLDHRIDLGTVTSPHRVTLPPNGKKVFTVPLSVKWNDAAALLPLGLSKKDVPWDADGTVKITAESLDVDVPFKVSGVVTHQQVMQAVGRSVPSISGIPGLPF
jgi:LEA14-like dessication related protein